MSMISTFSEREILSESNLHKAAFGRLGMYLTAEPEHGLVIDGDSVERIVAGARTDIGSRVSRLVKASSSSLEDLPAGCLYTRLDEPEWRTAAQICEIFRNPQISKNAGRLDTQSLQHSVAECLTRSEPFLLLIAWGQPKRNVGGLKTLGPLADLAEMYAIANLSVLVQAVAKLARRSIGLKVMTGGQRFFNALFTRPGLTKSYDAQRQRIADILAGPGVIDFSPYIPSGAEHGQAQDGETRHNAFDDALAAITDEMIASKFGTVLLNVDWDHLLAPSARARHHSPHGIPLPGSVANWLQGRDTASCNRLVRAAIGSLVFPRHQSEWLDVFSRDEEVLEDTISFIRSVAWDSTRKYIALHMVDANDTVPNAQDSVPANVLRLTVHEKRDRRDMPAIFTLGPKGGNQLSQHVMAAVDAAGQISFGSYAEYSDHGVIPVRLHPVGTYRLFDWLASTGQPICLIDAGSPDPTDRICKAIGASQFGV